MLLAMVRSSHPRITVIALILSMAAGAVEPRRTGQDSFLTRAVFAEGRLWMRSDAGMVFSVAPREAHRRDESLPGPVLDLCVRKRKVLALTAEGDRWTLRRHENGKWIAEASIAAGSTFATLDCASQSITVVTADTVFVVRDNETEVVKLSHGLPHGLSSSVAMMGDQLFVGANHGEWGGGLWRADLKTGIVAAIDRRSDDLCGGPLNADCDPVHGVTSEPWKPGCVVAAVGLVHMGICHGSLVEVCGDDVRTLLSRPFGRDEMPGLGSTVAFFGVIRSGDVLLAAGIDGLYRVSKSDVVREPLPSFKDVGGIRVSFDAPDVVFVLTNVNARQSVSGSVPMIVPRE
jgi:hypothetical protein